MIRRRLLLSMLNQFQYVPYSYEYLYYSLVSQTIDGKQVKNKSRVNTIYGNSVVENNLANVSLITRNSFGGIAITKNGNQITFNGTWDGTTNIGNVWLSQAIPFYLNHKYIVRITKISGSISGTATWVGLGTADIVQARQVIYGTNSNANQLNTCSETNDGSMLRFFSDGLDSNNPLTFTNYTFTYELIDLTQEYPFDTPTTLTDNRVQAILNRGYIPFNSGKIKSVDIGEISSEPYNLLNTNEIIKGKEINTSGQIEANVNSCYVMIDVLPSLSYTLELSGNQTSCMIVEFDKEGNFISRSGNTSDQTRTRTLNSRTYRVGITCWSNKDYFDTNTCFHRTGTRTGYAPHTSPQTLTFKYQGGGVGTSHDKMEITNTSYVFTKNIGSYTFTGSESWIAWGSAYRTITTSPLAKSTTSNILCSATKYTNRGYLYDGRETTGIDATQISNSTNFMIGSDTYTNVSSLTNATIQYELANPQVIRIPRKHLAIVDLGTLQWSTPSDNRTSSWSLTNILSNTTNIYCSKYMQSSIMGTTESGKIATLNQNVFIADSNFNGKTASEVAQLLSGIYLFYETQDEVADILTQIYVESGGTLTTDSDVLPNAIFDFKTK